MTTHCYHRTDELEHVEKEDLQWHRELLETAAGRIARGGADRRLKLSHLEEHIRELEQQWQLLRQAAADLQKQSIGRTRMTRRRHESSWRNCRSRLMPRQDELELARERLPSSHPSTPSFLTKDRHGTHRRPVYIECQRRQCRDPAGRRRADVS